MTDIKTVDHTAVLGKLNEVRDTAVALESISLAVNSAVVGTVRELEAFAATDGITSLAGLGEALDSSWAEKVNS